MNERCVAVMQPYVFPYIGYFHLIHASSVFVFFDDVHYIRRGWINRNRILYQGRELLFTIPVQKASRNKLIKDISPLTDSKWKDAFYEKLLHCYKKAPFFSDCIEPVMSVFSRDYLDITDLAIKSISVVLSYLGIDFSHTKSSICSPSTKGLEKADRLATITKTLGYNNYVNAIGGKELYSKEQFLNKGVNLHFVKSSLIDYPQYSECFVPWLSIIDIIMFCSKEQTIDFLSEYSLE